MNKRGVAYPRSLADYGAEYGRSLESIKAWVKRGKQVGDYPPLDNAQGLALWWRSYMKHAVPESIELKARELQAEGEPPPMELSDNMELIEFNLADEDLSADAGLLQTAAMANWYFRKFKEAESDSSRERARKNWESASNRLRQWEKDITKIREDRGELVRKAVVREELEGVFSTLSRAFEKSLYLLAEDLAPELGRADARDVVSRFRDGCFSGVKTDLLSS